MEHKRTARLRRAHSPTICCRPLQAVVAHVEQRSKLYNLTATALAGLERTGAAEFLADRNHELDYLRVDKDDDEYICNNRPRGGFFSRWKRCETCISDSACGSVVQRVGPRHARHQSHQRVAFCMTPPLQRKQSLRTLELVCVRGKIAIISAHSGQRLQRRGVSSWLQA